MDRSEILDRLRAFPCDRGEYWVVAGGAKAGNIASEMAVETFMDELRKDYYAVSVTDVQMLCAVKAANRLIYEKAQSEADYEGMGTTLVGMMMVLRKRLSIILVVLSLQVT